MIGDLIEFESGIWAGSVGGRELKGLEAVDRGGGWGRSGVSGGWGAHGTSTILFVKSKTVWKKAENYTIVVWVRRVGSCLRWLLKMPTRGGLNGFWMDFCMFPSRLWWEFQYIWSLRSCQSLGVIRLLRLWPRARIEGAGGIVTFWEHWEAEFWRRFSLWRCWGSLLSSLTGSDDRLCFFERQFVLSSKNS